MAIDYSLNWSDDTLKSGPFTLLGGTVDTTTTSLALTGKGYVNWGEKLQENLLHLLENFASDGTSPVHPTLGQLWYNDATQRLNIYFSSAWQEISMTGPQGPQGTQGPQGLTGPPGDATSGLGGGIYPISDGITLLGTGMVPVTLIQFSCPYTGYIALAANVGVEPDSSDVLTLTITGGFVIDLYRNSTCVSNTMVTGTQVPNGYNAACPLTGNTVHEYLAVTAGDVISVVGIMEIVNAPSNYHTVSPAGVSTANWITYHYISR